MLCVCFVSVVMHKDKEDAQQTLHRPRADLTAFDHTPLDGEMFLQALNGFLMILTCEGEVFLPRTVSKAIWDSIKLVTFTIKHL